MTFADNINVGVNMYKVLDIPNGTYIPLNDYADQGFYLTFENYQFGCSAPSTKEQIEKAMLWAIAYSKLNRDISEFEVINV